MQQLQVNDLGSNEVILDFNEHQLGHINIVQGDTLSRYLLITVVGPDGTIYQANPNIELRLYGVNSNYPERIITAYGTTFGHQYKVYIPSNMVTKAGELTIQVGLYQAGATEALIQSEKKVIPVLESMAHGGDVGGDAILDLGDLNMAIAKAQNLELEYKASLAEQSQLSADVTQKHTDVTTMYEELFDVLTVEQQRVEAENQRELQEGQRQANETQRASDFSLQLDNQQSTFTSQLGQQQSDFELQSSANQSTFGSAEALRESNETTRKANEVTRESNEDARELAETGRVNAETTRDGEEATRQANELERIANENARKSKEDDRILAEQSRVLEEQKRSTAESDRQRKENDRNTAETARGLAEDSREAKFNSWELEIEGNVVSDATDLSSGVVQVKSLPSEVAPYKVPTVGTFDNAIAVLKGDVAGKQDNLIAGDNIQILDNEISAVDTIYDDSGIKADIDTKQDKLIVGENIQIDDATNTISAVDTIYDDTHIKADIETKQDKLTAGDNINIVDGVISGTAQYDDTAISQRITTLENKEDKDTITTINGKTGAISKADITALGIPSQDTVYKKPSSEPISYIQGLQSELDSKVESYGTNSVMQIAVINAGGSTTGIPNNTLILELE